MKTTIKTIENAICELYKNVEIQKYYVEDENLLCQKIVIFGKHNGTRSNEEIQQGYFVASIIGLKLTKEQIIKEVEITENRYEALYMFKEYL